MKPKVEVQESAIQALLRHSSQAARRHGKEVIGWLLGFFGKEEVYVCDSIPCTSYRFQSRYGAEADPLQEAEVATSYPRNIGIVGVYHSHPFRREYEDAIFHSWIDDFSLRSRSSRQENYLSAVTDGSNLSFFIMDRGPRKIEFQSLERISYKDKMQAYRSQIRMRIERKWKRSEIGKLIRDLERDLAEKAGRFLKKGNAFVDMDEGTIQVPLIGEKASRNVVKISSLGSQLSVDIQLRMEPIIYVIEEEEQHILRTLKNEVEDDIGYLLRRGFSSSLLSVEKLKSLEVNLGGFKVQELDPLPKKIYVGPKRSSVLRKS